VVDRTTFAILLVVVMPAFACSSKNDIHKTAYSIARETCGLEEKENLATPYDFTEEIVYFELTEECVVLLSSHIGLDWSSFGADRPLVIDRPANTPEIIVAGLFNVLLSGVSSSGYVDYSDWLSEESIDSTDYSSSERQSAEAIWYEHIVNNIESVIYSDSAEVMLYAGDGVVVSYLLTEESATGLELPPYTVGAILLHEATHVLGVEHVACSLGGDVQCDEDMNGAYGVQLAWMAAWFSTYRSQLSPWDCYYAEQYYTAYCEHVLDDSDLGMCSNFIPECEYPG